MKNLPSSMLVLATAMGALACAHAPSNELVNARKAYEQAEGQAKPTAPAEVYEAEKALHRAERAHDKKPASLKEKDLAYIASRKAQYAIAYAEMKAAKRDEQLAYESRVATLEAQRDRTRAELEDTQGDLSQSEEELARKQAALRESKKRQAALEARLNDAMTSLHEIAKFKRDKDRMVITLNGSVIFKSESADLLPSAKRKLQEVAAVLEEYDDNNEIVVEGHTDASGNAQYNQTLSKKRANSVRAFLVSEGVDASAVTSVGKGETEPIASNKTPEGRANNRRVEIIIEKPSVAQR